MIDNVSEAHQLALEINRVYDSMIQSGFVLKNKKAHLETAEAWLQLAKVAEYNE